MSIFPRVETFLQNFCSSSAPLLLALSGGPDSLCLFHCLLIYRKQCGIPFHIAHVDHGWRQESQSEAQSLQQLALEYQIPFHLKTLNPALYKGNLEAACRQERYAFFAEVCQKHEIQAVLTGHHQDDQAETIFKRILEGAHWSRWIGLKSEGWIQGIRILRPLLGISKDEILQMLIQENLQAFDDPTNRYLKFLRARLRETIFPRLNQEFGKKVQNSFIEIGKEVDELTSYFKDRVAPLLNECIEGPWGIYLDLQKSLPGTLIEIKYLLRLLCEKQKFFLSREILEQAAQALRDDKASKLFVMGMYHIQIDRKRIFIIKSHLIENKHIMENECECPSQAIRFGQFRLGKWRLDIKEDVYSSSFQTTSWKEGWQGQIRTYLPLGNYMIGFGKQLEGKTNNIVAIRKRWNQAKVPNFLTTYFPLICSNTTVCHEFLTGKSLSFLKEDMSCWKIDLKLD